MIAGVGTDIVAIARMEALWQRHGDKVLARMLAETERSDCLASPTPARFLAKRFAAKEALAKALGTGLRAPLVLPNIAVAHDALGKPYFVLHGEAADLLVQRGLTTHLSLSDERDFAVAFVVVESA